MKNLHSLSDAELLKSTKLMAQQERELTLKVLRHLREVERRMLFARIGFSSLYDYARTELGYSEGAAHRRIASMRLLRELPELEAQVASGALPLSTLAQAQSFFRAECINKPEAKRSVIAVLQNKSHRDVQRELAARASAPERLIPETIRPLSKHHHKMSLVIDEEMLQDLEELRGLLAASRPATNLRDVLKYALKKTLEARRVKAPKNRAAAHTPALAPNPALMPTPAPELAKAPRTRRSRHVPVYLRRLVWVRDQGCCSYRDSLTGKVCSARSGLQLDHIQDFASGGTHSLENLRLRCRTHNTLAAVDRFGAEKMKPFCRSLRTFAISDVQKCEDKESNA
jgi:hypothetical protein